MGWSRKKRPGTRPTKEWVRGSPIVEENPRYERYYRDQQVCRSDEELERMMTSFRTALPVSFRISAATDLKKAVLEEVLGQKAVLENGQEDAPRRLEWYPEGLAFQWEAIARKTMRRNPALAEIKRYLVTENEMGAITRQEAVSMIPPLCLDVKSNNAVLDMCAAPGSKTSQIIDLSVMDTPGSSSSSTSLNIDFPAEAAVVANDVNIARARMLRHQLQRQGHPGSAVTNCDASNFPKALSDSALFDRVLADVLCSGDGTLRKNIDVWPKWTPRGGLQLHPRQLQILLRGLDLLAPQGRLVYSTCSLNPIEDEAVVAAALETGKGRFRLLPIPTSLANLEYSAGLQTWFVPNVKAYEKEAETAETALKTTIDSFEEFQQLAAKGVYKETLVDKTMFPTYASEEVRKQLPLCGRFLPHQNNSGGFFLAIFENTAVEPSVKKNRYAMPPPNENERNSANDITQTGDEFFRPKIVSLSDPDVESMINFYGLSKEFQLKPVESNRLIKDSQPRPPRYSYVFRDPRSTDQLDMVTGYRRFPLLRKEDMETKLYLATPRLIDMAMSMRAPVRALQYGVKAFDRLDDRFAKASGSPFRPMMEAAPWLIPFMRRRIVFATYKAVEDMLESEWNSHKLLELEADGAIANVDSIRQQRSDGEGAWLEPGGAYLVACDEFEAMVNQNPRQLGCLRIPCLLSLAGNMQALVKKQVKDAILLHLGGGMPITFRGDNLPAEEAATEAVAEDDTSEAPPREEESDQIQPDNDQ